ncbi:MAG: methyltransferase domain-containing protein [Methanomicrobiaceae archaeon]|nr:methyltransferase domain-containing protein [Methanomicrobiaceae archaeon]
MTGAEDYDEIARKCVPYYGAFYGTVLDFVTKDDKKILELACGTGMLTEMIVAKCPGAQVSCIDSDAWMIKKASANPALSGVEFNEGDMRNCSGNGYDAVVITQAIFFISDPDRRKLISNIYGMLNEGGRFISGDMFAPETEFEKKIYKKNWIDLMLSNGLSLPEAENMIAPIDDFCGINTIRSFSKELQNAGFSPVISPYRWGYYGVVAGYR